MTKISAPKITMFLMTEKGYQLLENIAVRHKDTIHLVVIGSDKALANDYAIETINFCRENGINYITKDQFKEVETEYVLAISWRWLINHPENKTIVFHDSLLPRYRGFAPLVTSLINGENEIGVTALFGADDYDAGDIICQSKTAINYPIKIQDAINKIHKNYFDCVNYVLSEIKAKNNLTSRRQDHNSATYSVWRDDDDYRIDWSKSANEIQRFVDALGYPYKGAFTLLENRVVRIISVEIQKDVYLENRQPGKTLFIKNKIPIVICGEGLLAITKAHFEEENDAQKILSLSKFRNKFH